jgi:hypothetical protein
MTDDNPVVEPDKRVELVETSPKKPRFGIPSVIIATLFALLYAYDLFEAIANLVELPLVYAAYNLDAASIPWWLLIVGVLLPPVVFALALLLGRRQTVFGRAVILLLGLAVVAGLSLGVIALEIALRTA